MPSHKMKKQIKTNKNKKNKNRISDMSFNMSTTGRPRDGLRKELRSGDGQTFTLEMALPASTRTAESRIFTTQQSGIFASAFTTSTSTPTFGATAFNLQNVDQYFALAAVFDQYRLSDIEVWLVPQVSESVSSAAGTLHSVIDLDDSVALTSVSQFGDYSNAVFTPIKTGHYRHFQPHVAIAAYSGTFASFANVPSPWIDTNSSTVQHYGIKYGSTITTVLAVSFDIYYRFKLEFRNIR